MRGASKDRATTKLLRENGLLLDARSFVSRPSIANGSIHLFFKGDDVICQRQRVWHRSKGKCAGCKRLLDVLDWEMDHKQGGTVGRCDCLHNLQALCRDCHRAKHVQPQFGKVVGLQANPAKSQENTDGSTSHTGTTDT